MRRFILQLMTNPIINHIFMNMKFVNKIYNLHIYWSDRKKILHRKFMLIFMLEIDILNVTF
jgi:hypothetical protein